MAEPIGAEALNYLTRGIQAEISAYAFYKLGAAKVSEEGFRKSLLHFAEEERKHFLTLEHHYDQYVRSEKWVTYRDIMNRDGLPDIDASMGDKQVKRIEQVKQASTTIEILQIALELEKEAYALYSDAAKTATAPDVTKTFEYLMNFEMGHVRNVEQMIAAAGK